MFYSNLKITAYEYSTDWDYYFAFLYQVGTYELQINPKSVQCSYGKDEFEFEPKSANGGPIPHKLVTYFQESVSFDFTLDLTGVIPSVPDSGDWINFYAFLPSEANYFRGLEPSIEKLKEVTIYPLEESHMPPYVHLIWGDISLKGFVSNLGINYTYFNTFGYAVRAEISITIEEYVNQEIIESKFRSPDLTRIPTIKVGDTIPALCKRFYSDKKYYLKIAEINNLPSFRRLKLGEKLLFPPLEK